MASKKKTLRRMQPITRRYARVINDLDGVLRRLRNLTEEVGRLESDSKALFNLHQYDYDELRRAQEALRSESETSGGTAILGGSL